MEIEAQQNQNQSKRGRVRELVIDPLVADGMRFERGVTAEDQAAKLVRMADDLAYLDERDLRAIKAMIRTNATGKARDVWPSRQTYMNLAHAVKPRPLEEMPHVMSWFASAAGDAAIINGTEVEEFEFCQRRVRPPIYDTDMRLIKDKAHDAGRRLQIISERERAGWSVDPQELRWREWYLAEKDRVRALIETARAARGAGQEAAE